MSQAPAKPLTLRQASNCENAREPVCKCRCGGMYHGARRGDGAKFFDALPAEDPHYRPDPERLKAEAAKRRLELAVELGKARRPSDLW